MMHNNPWDPDALKLQLCAIIIAPSFICVSIYLTLKHITLSVSPQLSRIKPRLYPIIFLPADLSCLVLQGIGGGIAAAATSSDPELLRKGDHIIMAGIALQVSVSIFFGITCVDYLWRASRWLKTPEATPEGLAQWKDRKFRTFLVAVAAAFSGILIRCIYR
jgi:hypothetical protein